MNSEQAHKKLKEIERQRNLIGVGGYRNAKRDKNNRHESFSKTISEMNAMNDKMKLNGDTNATTARRT